MNAMHIVRMVLNFGKNVEIFSMTKLISISGCVVVAAEGEVALRPGTHMHEYRQNNDFAQKQHAL